MLEQHALAGARGTQQRHGLAIGNREVHTVQHHLLAETLGDIPKFYHTVSSSCASRVSSSRISTDALTTAPVVERPTPSAPCPVLKPM